MAPSGVFVEMDAMRHTITVTTKAEHAACGAWRFPLETLRVVVKHILRDGDEGDSIVSQVPFVTTAVASSEMKIFVSESQELMGTAAMLVLALRRSQHTVSFVEESELDQFLAPPPIVRPLALDDIPNVDAVGFDLFYSKKERESEPLSPNAAVSGASTPTMSALSPTKAIKKKDGGGGENKRLARRHFGDFNMAGYGDIYRKKKQRILLHRIVDPYDALEFFQEARAMGTKLKKSIAEGPTAIMEATSK